MKTFIATAGGEPNKCPAFLGYFSGNNRDECLAAALGAAREKGVDASSIALTPIEDIVTLAAPAGPICPHCGQAIEEGDAAVDYDGKTFHRDCFEEWGAARIYQITGARPRTWSASEETGTSPAPETETIPADEGGDAPDACPWCGEAVDEKYLHVVYDDLRFHKDCFEEYAAQNLYELADAWIRDDLPEDPSHKGTAPSVFLRISQADGQIREAPMDRVLRSIFGIDKSYGLEVAVRDSRGRELRTSVTANPEYPGFTVDGTIPYKDETKTYWLAAVEMPAADTQQPFVSRLYAGDADTEVDSPIAVVASGSRDKDDKSLRVIGYDPEVAMPLHEGKIPASPYPLTVDKATGARQFRIAGTKPEGRQED